MNYQQLIDHTNLNPQAKSNDIDKLIEEAKKYHFKSVCVNGTWARYAHQKLVNTNCLLTVVIGFPLGANSTKSKICETKHALEDGADEIDMVINIGLFKEKKYQIVLDEIKLIKKQLGSKILKVIIETAWLSSQEIEKATQLVIESGADFIKTSTGFSSRGASFEDLKTIKNISKNLIGIKAAGGIKNLNDLKEMIRLGATRIGTSSAIKILNLK